MKRRKKGLACQEPSPVPSALWGRVDPSPVPSACGIHYDDMGQVDEEIRDNDIIIQSIQYFAHAAYTMMTR